MKLLIKIEELDNYKSRDKIPLECEYCHKPFTLAKNHIQCALKGKSNSAGRFCSRQCSRNSAFNRINIPCKQCGKIIEKKPSEMKYNKKRRNAMNSFCSHRCNGIYQSQHKTTGNRRSKLEKWLEIKLKELYPNLEIRYNDVSAIKAELDIFIPSLTLAFELNGIFHYENIFGQLERTQNNDKRKFQACGERGIELCVIDTSNQKYWKEKTAKVFLDIITNIVNLKLAAPQGLQP